jgi:hypothetical protein
MSFGRWTRQRSHCNKRAQIEACFRTDNDGRSNVADQAAQAGDGVTQLPPGNLGDANSRVKKPTQRALDAERQNDNADPFGGERIAEQDHIPLRAAAFESAQHNREDWIGN